MLYRQSDGFRLQNVDEEFVTPVGAMSPGQSRVVNLHLSIQHSSEISLKEYISRFQDRIKATPRQEDPCLAGHKHWGNQRLGLLVLYLEDVGLKGSNWAKGTLVKKQNEECHCDPSWNI